MTSVEPSVEQTTPEPAPVAEASPQNTPDVLSNPQSVRRRRRPPPLLPAERPEPTHAFGFIIPEECAERYAKGIVASCSDYGPGTEDYDCAVRCLTNDVLTKLPAHIHAKIPTLPTPHALPLLVRESVYFVYPLADNSCKEAYRVRISRRDLQLLREELGLPQDQKPRWFSVETL
ncbi:hypothetical protein K474DRAFT_1664808 [Panus rudis PR-1116 ss-1]|nr:hypothetical protein K474DRAFT_1664808 [Panus rudis PR-1116 ss-1]